MTASSTIAAAVRSAAMPKQRGVVAPQAWSRRVAVDIVAFADVAAVIAGGLVPAQVHAVVTGTGVDWIATVQAALVSALFTYLCLRHFGLYDIARLRDLRIGPGRLSAALGIAFAAALGVGVPGGLDAPRFWLWYATWGAISLTLLLASRAIARSVLASAADHGAFDTRVAIYGGGPAAERVIAALSDAGLGVRIVGVFDDRGEQRVAGHAAVPVAGVLADLIARGRAGDIDRIIVALPPTADRRLADISRRLEQLPSSLHVVTHIATDFVDAAPRHAVSSLGVLGLIDIKTKPLGDWGPHIKAAEDFCIGLAALLVAAPAMAVIALAVRLDSPGPALFCQRRHGLNRRVIEVMKFRTMRVQEDGAEVRQATAGDPRVTRLGRFLRSTSLDELPQLFNVLRGEMSLVGPRPHALVHDDHFGEMIERYANRHQVKPGMTGWAQVNGFRGPTETPDKMAARVDCDRAYIDGWSLWFDLRILAMTVVLGFKNKNAL